LFLLYEMEWSESIWYRIEQVLIMRILPWSSVYLLCWGSNTCANGIHCRYR
jgi:hypothetical protein